MKKQNKYRKLKRGHIYLVEWIDTYGYAGWFSDEEIDEKIQKLADKTVGFFIKEEEDFLVFCMNMCEDNDFVPYGAPKWIPKGVIRDIKELKERRWKK